VSHAQPEFLVIGEILRPWGYRGEVKIKLVTDFPTRLTKLKTVYLGPDARGFHVERARLLSGFAVMKLAGLDSPEAVDKLRGQLLQVAIEQAAPLRQGQYFHHQIIGLHVWTTEGKELGSVEEILETGANDVYVVRRSDGSEVLLPAIRDVVQEIDLENKRLVVQLIPGLI
jgi:16S rRNA processing protein RimM